MKETKDAKEPERKEPEGVRKGFSEEDEAILRNHVSSLDKDIYVIYNLPPEVVAVLFGYVSRSPAGFRENLLKLIKSRDLDMGDLVRVYSEKGIDYAEAKEKAKKFHERWVVGYGHSSVAEHAVASLAVENVSILATKVIEDSRLASYTEKSTRYQVFDRNKYYKPAALMDSDLRDLYVKTCSGLFDFYLDTVPVLVEHMKKTHPKPLGMEEKAYESVTKARACDIARFVLPAATLTNLAITINARSLEHMISKLMSVPIGEMNKIGSEMKGEVLKMVPTLVKYAERNHYIYDTDFWMDSTLKEEWGEAKSPSAAEGTAITLVDYDKDAENKIVASIIYKYTQKPFSRIIEKVRKMDADEKERIFSEFMKRKGEHDQPMRELEHAYYTFDVLVDYGAFRDIQRHRMSTQTNQALTTAHGYEIPREITHAGLEKKFRQAMENARNAFEAIYERFPAEAQYVVPLAYRKRLLFTMNLRELYHFIRVRSGREGHISYRKIAWNMFDEVKRVHPMLVKYVQIDRTEGPAR
jgi:thymidylate synthase ThyX